MRVVSMNHWVRQLEVEDDALHGTPTSRVDYCATPCTLLAQTWNYVHIYVDSLLFLCNLTHAAVRRHFKITAPCFSYAYIRR
jgi:hypothetical protein